MHLPALVRISCGALVMSTPLIGPQRPPAPARDTGAALREEQRVDLRPAPAWHEGDGPFDKLIIRGATVIDGTRSPPVGPRTSSSNVIASPTS